MDWFFSKFHWIAGIGLAVSIGLLLYLNFQPTSLNGPLSSHTKGLVTLQPALNNTTDYTIQGYFLGAEKKEVNGSPFIFLHMKQERVNGELFDIIIPEDMASVDSQHNKPSFFMGKENTYKRIKLRLRYTTQGETLKKSFDANDLLEWEGLIFFVNQP